MRTFKTLLVVFVLVGLGWAWRNQGRPSAAPLPHASVQTASMGDAAPRATSLPDFLPPQARDTLARIARGGPFAHRQDGGVFGNREGLLPAEPRGYYHEYTVETPGLSYRGARRIITGGTPPVIYYYTDDHYRSFRRFTVQP